MEEAVWEEKNCFPGGWLYANEYMFFRPALLYALVYGLIGNYVLALLDNALITLFVIASFLFYLCRSIEIPIKDIGIGIVLMLSFSGTGRSMPVLSFLFYGYYGIYLRSTDYNWDN